MRELWDVLVLRVLGVCVMCEGCEKSPPSASTRATLRRFGRHAWHRPGPTSGGPRAAVTSSAPHSTPWPVSGSGRGSGCPAILSLGGSWRIGGPPRHHCRPERRGHTCAHTPVHAPRTARDRLRGRATRAAAETVPGAPAACCCPFEILNGSRTSGPVLPTEWWRPRGHAAASLCSLRPSQQPWVLPGDTVWGGPGARLAGGRG